MEREAHKEAAAAVKTAEDAGKEARKKVSRSLNKYVHGCSMFTETIPRFFFP